MTQSGHPPVHRKHEITRCAQSYTDYVWHGRVLSENQRNLIRGFDRILSYHFRLGMLLDKVEINLDPAQKIVRSMQGR